VRKVPDPEADLQAACRYDNWFDQHWGHYAWRIESTAVLRAVGPMSGRWVADVGCGTARLTTMLAARGASVVGIDLDSAMLAVAAGRLSGRLVRADAAQLPLRDASVDVAVVVATLEFTRDPAGVLAEMARITRPGGRLVAAVLNPMSPWGWIGRVRRRAPYRDGRFLARSELLALGRKHGAAQIRGVLFAAEHLPLLRWLGPLSETIGAMLPRFGAVQILTIQRTRNLDSDAQVATSRQAREALMDNGPIYLDDGGLSPEIAARVYDRIGRLQDTQSPFERPAVDRLIAARRFEAATSVFEFGCGTGALAHRLLRDHIGPQSTYLGVDVSKRMVELARRRIAACADRARVVHIDGTLPLPAPDRSADRFIAAYVFDLLPPDYAAQVIDEAHRLLRPGGLACLVSLTHGRSTRARLISRSRHRIWRVAPRLVGGCRPIDLRHLFDPDHWDIDEDAVIESWGVPSELVVAAAR